MSDREPFETARAHGLKARNETREARAIRRQVAEEIALALADHPGPDPSPASPAWWAGYVEAQADMVRITRDIGTKETSIPPGDAPAPGPAGCTSVHPMASHIPCRKPAGHQGDHESRNGRNWRPRDIDKETPS